MEIIVVLLRRVRLIECGKCGSGTHSGKYLSAYAVTSDAEDTLYKYI